MEQQDNHHEPKDEAEPFIDMNEGLMVVAVACTVFMLAVAGALALGEHIWGYPYKALQTPALMDKYH